MPGAVEAVNALSPDWDFYAVTARWGLPRCKTNTVAWLNAHGIRVAAPVEYSAWPLPTDPPRKTFKAAVIRGIRERTTPVNGAPALVLGVGDRPSDMEAYVENGLRAFIITDGVGEMGARHDELLFECERKLMEAHRGGMLPAPAGSAVGSEPAPPQIEFFASLPEGGPSAWEQIQARMRELE
jgi:hypothetical protein